MLEVIVCWLMVALAAGAAVLSLVRGALATPIMVVGDVVMLAAMVDVCLISSYAVAPVMWGAALLALSLAAAASARFRRGRSQGDLAGHDGGHPLAMIIGAGLLMLMGAGGHGAAGGMADAHAHGAGASIVVAALVIGAVAHSVVVSLGSRSLARVEAARRLSGSGALVAMAAMAVAGA